jgi:ketosteroid isomerase-like protein
MRADIEWLPPPDDPDGRTYVGYEGVQEFWDQWREAVGQLRFEPLEVISHGDQVVVFAQRGGKGISSGLEIADQVIQVFSFDREGRCFRVREFYDRDEAMESVSGSAPE